MASVAERTCTIQTRERVLVGTLGGEVIALAETADDLACTCPRQIGLHDLLRRWLWLRLLAMYRARSA